MSDFLKDIIKETGNEYATLVSEGVEARDVDSFIDTALWRLTLYYLVQSMVVCHQTK